MAKTLRSAVETLERDKAQLMGRVQSLEQRLMGRQNSEGDSVKDIELTGERIKLRDSNSYPIDRYISGESMMPTFLQTLGMVID